MINFSLKLSKHVPCFHISKQHLKGIKVKTNKISDKLCLLERCSYLFLLRPVFLLSMLILLSNFSLTFQSHPLLISNLNDFEALQNAGMRSHVIDFLIGYPGIAQVCHVFLAAFHYHLHYHCLILGSHTLSSAALLFIWQQFLSFHTFINMVCEYSCGNLPRERKARKRPKI